MTNPEIQRYQTDPLYAYLNKRVVVLDGRPPGVPRREILIMEECALLSFRLGNLQAEIQTRPQDELSAILLNLYAPLAASSFGDVPTMDEFMAMPNEDIARWTDEARAVNAGFFAWIDAAEKLVEKLTDAAVKKKEKRRHKSVKKSPA